MYARVFSVELFCILWFYGILIVIAHICLCCDCSCFFPHHFAVNIYNQEYILALLKNHRYHLVQYIEDISARWRVDMNLFTSGKNNILYERALSKIIFISSQSSV